MLAEISNNYMLTQKNSFKLTSLVYLHVRGEVPLENGTNEIKKKISKK